MAIAHMVLQKAEEKVPQAAQPVLWALGPAARNHKKTYFWRYFLIGVFGLVRYLYNVFVVLQVVCCSTHNSIRTDQELRYRYCVFHNPPVTSCAKKNDSRSRGADFGMGGAVIFAPYCKGTVICSRNPGSCSRSRAGANGALLGPLHLKLESFNAQVPAGWDLPEMRAPLLL
jgi:hypothetical protein